MTTFVFVFWLTFFILSTDVVLCLNSGGSLFLNALRLESLPLHGFEPVFRLKSVPAVFRPVSVVFVFESSHLSFFLEHSFDAAMGVWLFCQYFLPVLTVFHDSPYVHTDIRMAISCTVSP